jgi:hypothetical protein
VAITSPFFCRSAFLRWCPSPAGRLLLCCLTPHLLGNRFDAHPVSSSSPVPAFTRRHGDAAVTTTSLPA